MRCVARDADLVEHDLAGRAAAQAHFVLVLGDADPPLLLDQEARDAPPAGVGVGLGEDDVDVGDAGVGDPVLRPGQHVVVAVAHGAGPHGGHVAPGVGLGEAVARLDLACRHPRHVRLLELLGAPVQHRRHPELGDQDGQRRRGADAGELLGHDRHRHRVGPCAAVGGRHAEGRQLHLLAGLERLPGNSALRSASAAFGATFSSQKVRRLSRKSRWTSVRAKVEVLTRAILAGATGCGPPRRRGAP